MRNVVNRSISFDPQLFSKMEERRARLMMQRSEYITRCVLKDMLPGGDMKIEEIPASFISTPAVSKTRAKAKPKAK